MSDPAPAPAAPGLSPAAAQFVEEFALTWEASNSPRMEGRIVGLLMIVDQPYLSSQQIAALLKASAGAVSGATRRLVEVGFVKRHVVPGDRNHYFRAEDDVWGSFLAGERYYLARLGKVIEDGVAATPPDAAGPRRRLANAQHYMEWLSGYHRKMLTDWQVYRDAHAEDGAAPTDTEGGATPTETDGGATPTDEVGEP